MSVKVIHNKGSWVVAKDGPNTVILGGTTIPHTLYEELKDVPHEAGIHYELDNDGEVVARAIDESKSEVDD